MNQRISFKDVLPDGYQAFRVSSEFSNNSGLEKELLELIKIRASQLNGCVFCLDMHYTDAKRIGVSEQKLYTLVAWHESPFFSEKEKAALALTDAMTLVAEDGVDDDIYDEALAEFGEEGLAKVMMAICVINTWNRLMVATQALPASYKK